MLDTRPGTGWAIQKGASRIMDPFTVGDALSALQIPVPPPWPPVLRINLVHKAFLLAGGFLAFAIMTRVFFPWLPWCMPPGYRQMTSDEKRAQRKESPEWEELRQHYWIIIIAVIGLCLLGIGTQWWEHHDAARDAGFYYYEDNGIVDERSALGLTPDGFEPLKLYLRSRDTSVPWIRGAFWLLILTGIGYLLWIAYRDWRAWIAPVVVALQEDIRDTRTMTREDIQRVLDREPTLTDTGFTNEETKDFYSERLALLDAVVPCSGVCAWLADVNLRQTVNRALTSAELKYWCEEDLQVKITQGQFIAACIHYGLKYVKQIPYAYVNISTGEGHGASPRVSAQWRPARQYSWSFRNNIEGGGSS